MTNVIEWLESPEGEHWSRQYHSNYRILATIKDDETHDYLYLWVTEDVWAPVEMVS